MAADVRVTPNLDTTALDVDLARLHVASRAVLDWAGDLPDGALHGAQLEQVLHHARVLVDMRGVEASPFAAVRAHALNVRNGLVWLASERSLTLAVWFDDALGLASSPGRPVSIDPAEDE
ncbi:hypothetical protein [Actinomycetospora straminea]|uniref:STAS domain-containing protein n=1 Tax=Actinomycetospora straminea TaxID=663607 RepID=A0ABP9ELX1_9PSEU|nr:hypothetical protein [Actinomycetospora straminea]MDD7936446.1 hypothetical protein [Actinomycetospora straminea]